MKYNELIERLRTESMNKAEEATSALGLYLDIESLVTELSEERYRHDRLQDYEVAQAQELERVKKERDAAVEDLASMCECCMVCIHGEETFERNDCEECESKCRCYSCVTGSNFTWKGQQKED